MAGRLGLIFRPEAKRLTNATPAKDCEVASSVGSTYKKSFHFDQIKTLLDLASLTNRREHIIQACGIESLGL